jgi:eukaryotic-like serine/threonine-protein kinase
VSKINCWEFWKCRRDPGGAKEKELGICPAATEDRMNGSNGGTNAGRSCWTVAGTFCFGEVQGTFARKFNDCMECEFFWLVFEEEEEFTPSA